MAGVLLDHRNRVLDVLLPARAKSSAPSISVVPRECPFIVFLLIPAARSIRYEPIIELHPEMVACQCGDKLSFAVVCTVVIQAVRSCPAKNTVNVDILDVSRISGGWVVVLIYVWITGLVHYGGMRVNS